MEMGKYLFYPACNSLLFGTAVDHLFWISSASMAVNYLSQSHEPML